MVQHDRRSAWTCDLLSWMFSLWRSKKNITTWARNVASDLSLLASFCDSCPDPPDGFQSIDSNGFWQILTEMNKQRNAERHTHGNAEIHRSRQLIKLKKMHSAEMQKCICANNYEHLRTSMNELQESTKICEHLRTSAKFCEQQHGCEDAETQKHTNIGMETCSSTEIHKFRYICGNVEMRKCRTA